jgi:hypothetical protein
MVLRFISAIIVGSALLLVPVAVNAADRGPSTPAERKQALDYIHRFQADPLNPELRTEREWVIRWSMTVPDVVVHLCPDLAKLPKGEKKDGITLFTAMTFAETAYALESPHKQDDAMAQYQAGVEGVLNTYAILLKTRPKDREPFLDDLAQRRVAGTLAEFVRERADETCHQ